MQGDGDVEDEDETPIITLFTSQMTSSETCVLVDANYSRMPPQLTRSLRIRSLKNLAQRNVIMDYSLLEPRVVPIVYTTDDEWAKFAGSQDVDAVEEFETNSHGTPSIRGFFNHAMSSKNLGCVASAAFFCLVFLSWPCPLPPFIISPRFSPPPPLQLTIYPFNSPKTQFYAYANGDILFDKTLIRTLEGVSKAIKAGVVSKKVLVVGKRTNHDITAKEEIKDYESLEQIVMNLHNKGALFQANAEDYFIATEGAIDWHQIPQFVIGRRAYDNWLVDHVYHKDGVDLIDATATLRAVHQTTAHGNFAGHRATPDSEWNVGLGQGQWDHGQTTDANFATRYRKGTSGEVIVVPSTPDPNSMGGCGREGER